jgi:endonuclease/exonuclease/phosphatase family metal-dependent hydrolase
MRVTRPLLAAVGVCLAAACSDEPGAGNPFGPGSEPMPEALHGGLPDLTVMTRNMYVGADVDAVIAALVSSDPADDQVALAEAIATLRETDFPARAAAMADEIARTRPHVVGLQEVSTIDIQLPLLGVALHLEFLPQLLSELATRGLQYDVAARVSNIQAAPFPGVSLLDEDAILVDPSRVAVHRTVARSFSANIGPVAPGVVLARGWVAADVTVDGRAWTIASTHFEPGEGSQLVQLRAAQALELVQALAGTTPAVIMGDLNDMPGSPMYQVLAGAGFTDLWTALRASAPGYTCCHAPDLSNQVVSFDERIDYILARDGGEDVKGRIELVGEVPADRFAGTAHPLWPSDHAGLVARLITQLPTP